MKKVEIGNTNNFTHSNVEPCAKEIFDLVLSFFEIAL